MDVNEDNIEVLFPPKFGYIFRLICLFAVIYTIIIKAKS